MTLNIEQLLVLADRLDAEGRHKEAAELDGMINKLSAKMYMGPEGEPPPEPTKKRKSKEDIADAKQLEKQREENKTSNLLPPSQYPDPEPGPPAEALPGLENPGPLSYVDLPERKSLQRGLDSLDWSETKSPDQSVLKVLEDMRKAGWEVFAPGERELWMSHENYVKAPEVPGVRIEDEPGLEDFEVPENKVSGKLARVDVFQKLANIADHLDKLGATEEASLVDGFINKHAEADDYLAYQGEDPDGESSKRYDSKYHHALQIREPKKDQERIDREGREKHHVKTMESVEASALSTRYCPEHLGVTVGRVGELTYQCPLDGSVYNWETGWVDYDGKEHPGGSIAGQTGDSSRYETGHRVFDSRENTLNRVN